MIGCVYYVLSNFPSKVGGTLKFLHQTHECFDISSGVIFVMKLPKEFGGFQRFLELRYMVMDMCVSLVYLFNVIGLVAFVELIVT